MTGQQRTSIPLDIPTLDDRFYVSPRKYIEAWIGNLSSPQGQEVDIPPMRTTKDTLQGLPPPSDQVQTSPYNLRDRKKTARSAIGAPQAQTSRPPKNYQRQQNQQPQQQQEQNQQQPQKRKRGRPKKNINTDTNAPKTDPNLQPRKWH